MCKFHLHERRALASTQVLNKYFELCEKFYLILFYSTVRKMKNVNIL